MQHLTGTDALRLEAVALEAIAAQFGTPTYVYSRAALTDAYHAYEHALAGRRATLCYAVKANSNLGILDAFARLGAGFDFDQLPMELGNAAILKFRIYYEGRP